MWLRHNWDNTPASSGCSANMSELSHCQNWSVSDESYRRISPLTGTFRIHMQEIYHKVIAKNNPKRIDNGKFINWRYTNRKYEFATNSDHSPFSVFNREQSAPRKQIIITGIWKTLADLFSIGLGPPEQVEHSMLFITIERFDQR